MPCNYLCNLNIWLVFYLLSHPVVLFGVIALTEVAPLTTPGEFLAQTATVKYDSSMDKKQKIWLQVVVSNDSQLQTTCSLSAKRELWLSSEWPQEVSLWVVGFQS